MTTATLSPSTTNVLDAVRRDQEQQQSAALETIQQLGRDIAANTPVTPQAVSAALKAANWTVAQLDQFVAKQREIVKLEDQADRLAALVADVPVARAELTALEAAFEEQRKLFEQQAAPLRGRINTGENSRLSLSMAENRLSVLRRD